MDVNGDNINDQWQDRFDFYNMCSILKYLVGGYGGGELESQLQWEEVENQPLLKAATLIFPFSWVVDFFFLPPCSSLIGPHLLPMSLSINDSARNGLKCFHLSVSECSPTYGSKLITLHVWSDMMIMKLKCSLSAQIWCSFHPAV